MIHSDTAARTPRRALHMPHLVYHFWHPPCHHSRSCGGVADCGTADFSGGPNVAIHQSRGDAERVGHVVETVTGIVGRQHRVDVHIKAEKVANRVAVFGAVEPMQVRRAGVGVSGGHVIDIRRQGIDKQLHFPVFGFGQPHGRHTACDELADNFFREVRILLRVGEIEFSQ